MKKFSACFAAVLSLLILAAFPSFADEGPIELQRDRQRAAQALREKNPQRAASIIEPWLRRRPDDVALANDYALSLAQMGKLDQAREVLEEALNKNPQTALAFQNLREILGQQAAISYAKAMGKKPPSSEVALKGSRGFSEPPVVVAKAAPRPDSTNAQLVSPKAGLSPDIKFDPRPGTAPTEPVSDEDALVKATMGWADAWANKDFKRYLDFYSEKFEPQQHSSREAWAAYRKPRVTRPDPIVLKVSDIKVSMVSPSEAEVRFRQYYEAGALKVSSLKTAVWIKEAGAWRMLREDGR